MKTWIPSVLRVLGATLGAEVLLVALAFAWVALYSHVLSPGGTVAEYREYAKVASPFVSLVAGIPVFYLLGRWLGRRGAGGVRELQAAVALYLLIDLVVIFTIAEDRVFNLGMFLPNVASKLGAAWIGVRGGRGMASG